MSDPANLSRAAGEAAASGFTASVLAVVGVPPLALLWAAIGAVVTVFFVRPESPRAAILTVLAGGLSGAAGGYGAASWISGGPVTEGPMLVLASLVVGAGAKQLLSGAIAAAAALIARLGGEATHQVPPRRWPPPPPPPPEGKQ